MHDLVIVGGGPAGLTAGIYAVRRAMSTLIIEKGVSGGQMLLANTLENYPGFESVSGADLAERMRRQAEALGVEFASDEATSIDLSKKAKTVRCKEQDYSAKAVIIASGGEYRRLGVAGEKEFLGRGVSYCATCDAPFFQKRKVAIVGGGNKAVSDALYLADIASEVCLIHRRDKLRAEEANQEKLRDKGVKLLLNSTVEEFAGEKMLNSVKLRDTASGETKDLSVDGVFISIGTIPHSEVAVNSGVEVDQQGFIKTGRNQETNIPGIYAAGDVTGGVMQVSTAVGEGCIAALSAYKYVKEPYW